MEEYIETTCNILEILPQSTLIQRLNGDPNPKTLVAPQWTLKKMEILNNIEKTLKKRDSFQGKFYNKL